MGHWRSFLVRRLVLVLARCVEMDLLGDHSKHFFELQVTSAIPTMTFYLEFLEKPCLGEIYEEKGRLRHQIGRTEHAKAEYFLGL